MTRAIAEEICSSIQLILALMLLNSGHNIIGWIVAVYAMIGMIAAFCYGWAEHKAALKGREVGR